MATGIAVGKGQLAPWLETGVLLNEVGTIRLPVPAASAPTTWAVDHVRRGDQGGVSESLLTVVDSARTWEVTFNPQFKTIIVDSDVTSPDEGIFAGLFDDELHHVRFQVAQDGSDLDWTVYVDGVSRHSGTETSLTNGALKTVELSYIPPLTGSGLAFGHVAVYTSAAGVPSVTDASEATFGHLGELAGRRVERLCSEENIAFTSTGDLDDTEGLGPQYPDKLPDILQEAAGTDLGILHDAVTQVGLHYRTRVSLYNQAAALTLDFDAGEVAPLLEPAVDDQQVRNDVTVTRRDGDKDRQVDQDLIDAVGRYDTQATVNTAGDGFLQNQAGWRLHLGVADDDRFPSLSVDLDANPELAATVSAVRPGDRVDLLNLPATLSSAGIVSLMVQGWAETIGSHRRVVTFNCTPYGPWQVGVYEAAEGDVKKYDTAGSELDEDLTATETDVSVLVTVLPLWTTDDDETPFDIEVGGEVMTVTDVAAAVADVHVFTVVRSVNGVTKTHTAGAPVRLAPRHRAVYAL